jgi:hypothetical protein
MKVVRRAARRVLEAAIRRQVESVPSLSVHVRNNTAKGSTVRNHLAHKVIPQADAVVVNERVCVEPSNLPIRRPEAACIADSRQLRRKIPRNLRGALEPQTPVVSGGRRTHNRRCHSDHNHGQDNDSQCLRDVPLVDVPPSPNVPAFDFQLSAAAPDSFSPGGALTPSA